MVKCRTKKLRQAVHIDIALAMRSRFSFTVLFALQTGFLCGFTFFLFSLPTTSKYAHIFGPNRVRLFSTLLPHWTCASDLKFLLHSKLKTEKISNLTATSVCASERKGRAIWRLDSEYCISKQMESGVHVWSFTAVSRFQELNLWFHRLNSCYLVAGLF